MYIQESSSGSSVIVQGLECKLPPPGFIKNYLTGKFECIGVYKRSRTKHEQYWEIDPRWKKYEAWREEELERQKRDPKFVHPDLQKFIKDCWLYRLGGFWFSNNGVQTYITGRHWYYLSCYYLDVGLPIFKEIDLEYFYFVEYAFNDPNSLGIVELTKRRIGKSYRAGCIALEIATRTYEGHVGIQSKTDIDASKFFNKTIIKPYRKLPYFFKPVTNLPQNGRMSSNSLKFETGKAVIGNGDVELQSSIDYESSNEMGYDGQKLVLYIGDEAGKTTTANINDRLDIISYCLKDDQGNIIGKTIHTTTVEKERETKASRKKQNTCDKNFFKLWQDSNQYEKTNGQTKSRLYRFFIPADRTRHTDKYGRADRERSRREILAEREAVRNDPRRLANLKRKEPLDEREAFQQDATDTSFNAIKLISHEQDLRWSAPEYITGDFEWKIKNREVEFIPNEGGRFKVLALPPEPFRNRHISFGGVCAPENTSMYYCGIDPYDHKFTTANSAKGGLSKGCFSLGQADHPALDSAYKHTIVCFYRERPISPEFFYEDVIKALFYYGAQALIENTKPGLINHMVNWGYEEYVAKLPGKETPGIAAHGNTNNLIASYIDTYINKNIEKIKFVEYIEDFLQFDPEDTKPYDAAMSFGYAEIHRDLLVERFKNRDNSYSEDTDISKILPSWIS